jgi:hypothetical protein
MNTENNTLQLNQHTFIFDVKKCIEAHENIIKTIRNPVTKQPYIDRLNEIKLKLK